MRMAGVRIVIDLLPGNSDLTLRLEAFHAALDDEPFRRYKNAV